MKKTLMSLALVFVLVLTLLSPAAMAEDAAAAGTGLDELMDQFITLTGEDVSGNYLLENAVKKLLIYIQEKAEEQNISVEELLDTFVAGLKDENGKFDSSKLLGLLMSGFGSSSGSADEEEGMTAEEVRNLPYFKEREFRDDAVGAHVIDEYRDSLETGDVQLVFKAYVMNAEDDPLYNLGYFELHNFKADGTDLKLMSIASSIEYLAFEKNEAGEYVLAEAIRAEEGDGFEASLGALLEKYGASREQLESQIANKNYYITGDMMVYLENHPEYERIEYNGELRTLDEMQGLFQEAEDAMWDNVLEGVDMSDLADLFGGD